MKREDQQRAFLRALREAAPLLGLGTSLAFTVLLGLGVGALIDAKLGSKPFGLLGGAVLGIAAAAPGRPGDAAQFQADAVGIEPAPGRILEQDRVRHRLDQVAQLHFALGDRRRVPFGGAR